MTESLVLTETDRQSAVWKKLSAHLDATLAEYRRNNDSSTLSTEATAKLRGRIAECKDILALGESDQVLEPERE